MLKNLTKPLLLFFLLCIPLVVIAQIPYQWNNWQPATCFPDRCFCEAIRNSIIHQPANTWSSLAFVLVGLIVMQLSSNDHSQRNQHYLITKHAGLSTLFAIALMIIGLGSAFYHASLTFIGQFFDVFGMYLIATFIIIYALNRTNQRISMMIRSYILLNLVLALALWFIPDLRRYLFGMLIVIGLLLEVRSVRSSRSTINVRYLNYALIAMTTAFIIWILDLAKIVCFPTNLIQGHAMWHLLGAISALYLYLYYCSERDVATN